MSKIGFLQDLVRGVNKVLGGGKEPEHARGNACCAGKRRLQPDSPAPGAANCRWRTANGRRRTNSSTGCWTWTPSAPWPTVGKFLAGAHKRVWRTIPPRESNKHAARKPARPWKLSKQTKRTLPPRWNSFAVPGYVTKTAVKDLYAPPQKFASRGRILACGGARRTGAAGKRPQFEKSQGICRGCVQENLGR